MRVVITGASGNIGTSLLQALADEPQVESIVGVARRRPAVAFPRTEWVAADDGERPLGQKLLLVDGEEFPILEVRELDIASGAATST